MKYKLIDKNISVSDLGIADSVYQNRAIDTIVLAFSGDPNVRWLWPESSQYLEHAGKFFRAFGGRAFKNNSANQAGNYASVALWLPPEVHPDEDSLMQIFDKDVDASKHRAIMAVFEQMEYYKPKEPHWYLPLIGVDPAKQGFGYGSALMKYALERIDQEGHTAYLENTNPANTTFYEGHGFTIIDTIEVDGAPPLFPMIRYPKL